jgi:nucleoside-diphosphate-sugar epimerase
VFHGGYVDVVKVRAREGQDWQQCEILTLHAGEQWHGAGTALIEAVGQLARRHGCGRLWVITTNDNVDALRFYQRRGADAVVFAAGAGPGSGAPRKDSVDRAASVLMAEAAGRAGVRRFVQVSSMGAGHP